MTEKNANREILIILWAMFLLSQIIYLFILSALVLKNTAPAVPIAGTMLFVFAGMALILLGLALFVPRLLLRRQLIKQRLTPTPLSALGLGQVLQLTLAPLLIRLAFFESICVFGFISAFLAKDMRYFLPYFSISAVGFILNFPSEKHLRRLLEGANA